MRRKKDKLMLVMLLVTFVATSGMFYYQNVYLKQKDESNKVIVLVAKKNISEGSEFTTENIGAIKIDKEMVLPTYITKFDELKGKSASDDILQNEVVTKPRTNGESDGTKQFVVGIESKLMPQTVQKGDAVRVYVQESVHGKVYELFHKKEVVSTLNKKSASGKDTATVQSIDLLMSDKEAVVYYNARKVGDILIVRYNDLTEEDTVKVSSFEENFEEIAKLIESKKPSNSANKEESKFIDQKIQDGSASTSTASTTDSTQYYYARTGDTFESIASAMGITVEKLKESNPGVTTISPGDQLVIKK